MHRNDVIHFRVSGLIKLISMSGRKRHDSEKKMKLNTAKQFLHFGERRALLARCLHPFSSLSLFISLSFSVRGHRRPTWENSPRGTSQDRKESTAKATKRTLSLYFPLIFSSRQLCDVQRGSSWHPTRINRVFLCSYKYSHQEQEGAREQSIFLISSTILSATFYFI